MFLIRWLRRRRRLRVNVRVLKENIRLRRLIADKDAKIADLESQLRVEKHENQNLYAIIERDRSRVLAEQKEYARVIAAARANQA